MERDAELLAHSAAAVLSQQGDALHVAAKRVSLPVARAALRIVAEPGRVVVTGMGKSGLVGRKIAATLASTGTPAFFLHPAEAQHGDLGMVTRGDTLLALSYSGETDELLSILPFLKEQCVAIIAITGNPNGSTLARAADIVIDTRVERESCPHNLAPTTSTTLMLSVGDALAVTIMHAREFSADSYAKLHPSGSLGRRLTLKVGDIMRKNDQLAVVNSESSLYDALFAITKARAGAACVVSASNTLIGILTDGDVRRFLLAEGNSALAHPVADAMTHHPRVTMPDLLAFDAIGTFSKVSGGVLGDIPVIDAGNIPVGMLMLKDLVRAGFALPHND